MPGTISESIKSRSVVEDGDNSSVELVYDVLGTDDESEAMFLLLTTAPAYQIAGGKLLSKVRRNVEPVDYNVWRAIADYSKRSIEASESSYQFETGGGTVHLSHSLQTLQIVSAPGFASPDFQNAIGVSRDGIAGCDITSPVYNFSETHVLPASAVSAAYKVALFRATGKVCNAPFKGLEAGEVLFLGASGSSRGDDEWEIGYRFAASENVQGLTIGELTGINKKGWDYLWLYFADDVSENLLIKRPLHAIVEQVYLPHDFANIGIGT